MGGRAGVLAGPVRALILAGDAGREALVVKLDGDLFAQAQREALRERTGLARLIGVPPFSDTGSPMTTRSTSRARINSSIAASPRRSPGRAIAWIGVTIVPDGSLTAHPQRALP